MTKLTTYYKKHSNFLNEFIAAIIVISAVLAYSMAPVLFAPNSSYPYTVDGMGHLAKIKYIADSLRSFHLPDWFPYWYNGSTVTQYYPPLSYMLQIPVQLIFDNTMITFKYFAFSSMFVGAMGVWYTCYRFWGPWRGLLAGSLYAIQPFLILSLLVAGLVAQGPVFALTPWLLYFTICFFKKSSPGTWLSICILACMLILSHVMHAFMICLCIGISIVILMLAKKVDITKVVQWTAAIALGCGLAAFWWISGVTQLENPGIPYLLSEATLIYTANLSWFWPLQRNGGRLYFSLSMLIISLGSIPFLFTGTKQPNPKSEVAFERVIILLNIILLVLTFIFSFGQNNPVFRYIPFSQSLVPGRVLSLSSVSAAILSAYVITNVLKRVKIKYLSICLVVIILAITLIDVNPKTVNYLTKDSTQIKEYVQSVPEVGSSFDKSRFTWLAPVNSNMTYFPLLYDFNMSDGWNIEGTPHNRALWLHNIAIASDNNDYVLKNLFQWNAHAVVIDQKYTHLKAKMEQIGYREINKYEETLLMHRPGVSSYFYRQTKDAIAIGNGIQGLTITFPWISAGTKACLDEYSLEELSQYKLIYFVEPEIKNLAAFESKVKQLIKQGKTIIIEMGNLEDWPILGVMSYDVDYGRSAFLHSSNDNIKLPLYLPGQSCALSGLDAVYYTLQENNHTWKYPVVGKKNIEGKNVYFVGLGMSQLLSPSIIRNAGVGAVNPSMSARDQTIEALLEALMSTANPSKTIELDKFEPDNVLWNKEGVNFEYTLDKTDDIVISLTYAPRWKVFLDGNPLTAYNYENLILLRLPSGSHTVELRYALTWVGWVGRALSLLSLIFILFIAKYFDKTTSLTSKAVQRFLLYWK